ncbi:MAG: hypothetical protein QM736_28385 [Vicinamibacterales bacterium]
MPAQLPGPVCQILNGLSIDAGTLCRASSPAPAIDESSTPALSTRAIVAACEARWDANKGDCSGFVRAVAADLGITIRGLANDIVDQMASGPWVKVASGSDAKRQADLGRFVLGGLKAKGHGHVVVVVAGPLAKGQYPTAYWGRLGGEGRKATTINWAWNADDRDLVTYAYYGGSIR